MKSSEQLRNMLKEPGLIQLPGCFDCITAMLAWKAGFPALYLTGSGMSLTMTGHPDLNTISYTEVRQIAENIRSAVPIPLMVDIDTGFGGPLNIYRLLKDFERLDIAAVQIEDQKAPKKCGHEPGRKVVEPEEMIKRIAMLKDNRANNGIVIVARTDARMKQYDFCNYPNGYSRMLLACRPEDDRFYYNDYSAFNGMTVATI